MFDELSKRKRIWCCASANCDLEIMIHLEAYFQSVVDFRKNYPNYLTKVFLWVEFLANVALNSCLNKKKKKVCLDCTSLMQYQGTR